MPAGSSRDNTLNDCNLPYIIKETTPTLTDQESLTLEGNITCEEILTALKLMKNGKSPGTDGFSVEFYKMFWSDLKQCILRSYNHAFKRGQLSISQKQGIISIIPKGNKPREFLKNWRPIALLNTSYKLLAACLANRLKSILHKLIHVNQKGFLK